MADSAIQYRLIDSFFLFLNVCEAYLAGMTGIIVRTKRCTPIGPLELRLYSTNTDLEVEVYPMNL